MSGRILVIRGGAIGDFILTLPALRLLREGFPSCRIEIVGYKHICALAEGRFYADAARSIEYAPMAGFFNPRATHDEALSEYFASFGQVVSYLFDPDGTFGTCLRMAGVKNYINGSPKITDEEHAAIQLARPLEQMALYLENPAAAFFPSASDIEEAGRLLDGLTGPFVAVHIGSGGGHKNWPLRQWKELLAGLAADKRIGRIILVSGESDTGRLQSLRPELPPGRVTVLESIPLCALGAVFARCALFVGHDSGISHLAAAAGARCLLLFGPTDPEIWAPQNPGVEILTAMDGDLSGLEFRPVAGKVQELLNDV